VFLSDGCLFMKPAETTQLLVRTVQELSMARSIDRVMEIVRTVARQLTGADGATFILRDGDKCYYADEDAITPLWKGNRFPIHSCISGWAMLNKQPAVIEDIYVDPRIPHDAYRPTFVKSMAMVPIRTLAPIGAIGNYWATQRMPTPEEVTLLQSLADITAVTIENVNVYNELEDRVKLRTEQLEAANLQLQSVNKELEAFSYSISHDLRAPLRMVIGYSEILGDECGSNLTPEAKGALDTLQRNANRMNQLIDDLLRFAHLGRKTIGKTHVSNNETVKAVIEELNASAEKVDFKIKTLPDCFADFSMLKQVWTNLISNAVKYSRNHEQPVVEIGAYDEQGEVIYYVKDNGAGFDMTYAHKLFGVFQRLHGDREFEGTGIGLALVKRIVSKHGGRVWAEGAIGKGATFYFAIPESYE
jgi:signal transduction histidine kinase